MDGSGGRALRIAIVDESAARAAVIEEGLRDAGLSDVTIFVDRRGIAARLEALSPDVVLINLANPHRDELEELFALSKAMARPVAMFVDQSDVAGIEAAIDAGVSAYVVDGFRPDRIKPILNLAIRRFNAFSTLQNELADARNELAERKLVDEAKRLIMRRRALSEPDAYKVMRSHAMQNNQRIAEVARAIVTAERLMGGIA
mgnify:CR=1 FL=1